MSKDKNSDPRQLLTENRRPPAPTKVADDIGKNLRPHAPAKPDANHKPAAPSAPVTTDEAPPPPSSDD